jgi:hypothetical protein
MIRLLAVLHPSTVTGFLALRIDALRKARVCGPFSEIIIGGYILGF